MLFRRKPQEAPEPQGAEQPADEHEAVLRDELGLYHLWFLELRLSQELARVPTRERLLVGHVAAPPSPH